MNVSVLIVFFSFLILGTILTLTITNYWANEKRQVLDNRADNVVSFIRRHHHSITHDRNPEFNA